jgi:hypothetical protein
VANAKTLGCEARQEARGLATEGARKTTTDNQHKLPRAKPTEAKGIANAEMPQGRPPKDASLRIYWGARGRIHRRNEGVCSHCPREEREMTKDNRMCPFCLLHERGILLCKGF